LWLLDHLPKLDAGLVGLQSVLVLRAEGDFDVVVNGYTHLQRAQPILLSHWWLSYFWPFQRDRERLVDLRARTARSPLGAAALAGTPFPIDRDALARELGFEGPSENSIDAVSDRDFIAEFLFCCALTGIHLSKLAEAVILFSSAEFGYLELPDAFTTGSSLMPQKKNPDIFELARGKSGTLIGHLTGLMAMLKGLPSAYDKDLQEDKQPMFAAYDTLSSLLPVVSDALRALEMHPERMLAAIDPATMATDLADELVRTGIPFRQAHSLVGEAVRYAETQGKSLDQLKSGELRAISPALDLDLASILDPWRSIRQRNCIGGSAPEAVKAQIRQARDALPDHAPIQME
jgi:argininosuccinate lyase